jgi:hypothetical protein
VSKLSAGHLPALVIVVLAAGVSPAHAQLLPSRPIELANGRLVVSAEVSASLAADDAPGYFNYTDYSRDPLRMFHIGVLASWQPLDRLAFLTEVYSDNLDGVQALGAYVRFRPWPTRIFDIQAGIIPTTFGAFSRRGYSTDNPLIGLPLAYQYLTTVRGDALPATADNVLRQRGHGWLVSYPIGNPQAAAGLPLVSALDWDTGVQLRVGTRPVEASAAVTLGTLSRPRRTNDNGGLQVSGRVAWRPTAGWVLGVSAAQGPFASHTATDALPAYATGERPTQRAAGVDAEYSRGHWLVRSEAVFTSWSVPAVDAPRITSRLRATGAFVEGRYRLSPRIYVAGRVDHLGFSRLTGTLFGGQPETWDAPVTRIEAGGGYLLRRNVMAKAVYQHNWRDGGRPTTRHFISVELMYWF